MTTVINTKKVSLMFILHVMFRDAFGIGQKKYTKYTYYIARPGNGNPPISSFHWHNLFHSSVNFVSYFRFSLSLLTKMLIRFSPILVIVFLCSFSLVLVDEKSLHFSQLLVKMFSLFKLVQLG